MKINCSNHKKNDLVDHFNTRKDNMRILRKHVLNDLERIRREIINYLEKNSDLQISASIFEANRIELEKALDALTYKIIQETYSEIEYLDGLLQITAVSRQNFEYVLELIETSLDKMIQR